MLFQNSYLISQLFPEVLLCRRVAFDNFPMAKGFGCYDKTRRYRQAVFIQPYHVQPLAAQMNYIGDSFAGPVKRCHNPFGIVI